MGRRKNDSFGRIANIVFPKDPSIARYRLVTITGPSCSGKTTLTKALADTGKFIKVVSFTSRKPREGEVEGVDYYFKTRQECEYLIDIEEVVEFNHFNGHIYGIEKHELRTRLLQDKMPVMIVEPHGLTTLKDMYGAGVFSIYVTASMELLITRFLSRFKEDVNAEVKYYTRRFKNMMDEYIKWDCVSEWNKYIKDFTSGNQDDIINSLITEILPSD